MIAIYVIISPNNVNAMCTNTSMVIRHSFSYYVVSSSVLS